MKFITFVIYLLTITCFTTLPQTLAEILQPQCHDPETDYYWPVGGNYSPIGRCITFHCFADRQKNAKTCSAFYPRHGCKLIPEDLTKPYPKCCPRNHCQEKS